MPTLDLKTCGKSCLDGLHLRTIFSLFGLVGLGLL